MYFSLCHFLLSDKKILKKLLTQKRICDIFSIHTKHITDEFGSKGVTKCLTILFKDTADSNRIQKRK